jgi:hypothetical protein
MDPLNSSLFLRMIMKLVENAMVVNPAKSKAVCFMSPSDGTTKLFVTGHSNSGSEQL